MLAQLLGGIGLFLIGMVLTTDGLRAAAGSALRGMLLRFTGGPVKALLSGIVFTAAIQSSTATTMATIGFVGAGLLTFHQSLGVIFGANVGTTVTGWLVAGLGLKFSVSAVALPIVGIGALVRLFTRGRAQHVGLALAGFGMVFVGIDVLQAGMAGVSERLTPASFPGDSFGGRMTLVGIGALLTAVMQSSTAATATTLTALHSGSIAFPQAAAVVIGANIGTTVTAAIAAAGTSVAAKRTALAHLLFNVVAAVAAFSLLPAFEWAVARFDSDITPDDATLALAAFHTAFNVAGVLLVLPFSRRFAALVERLIKDRGPQLTRNLDPRVAGMGAIAIEAVRGTAHEIAGVAFAALRDILLAGQSTRAAVLQLQSAASAQRDAIAYLGRIRVIEQLSEAEHDRHLSTIHALDHLGRLLEDALAADTKTFAATPQLRETVAHVDAQLEALLAWEADRHEPAPVDILRHAAERVAEERLRHRAAVLARVARGQVDPVAAEAQIEAMRWLNEIAHSLYRIADHLSGARALGQAPEAPTPSDGETRPSLPPL